MAEKYDIELFGKEERKAFLENGYCVLRIALARIGQIFAVRYVSGTTECGCTYETVNAEVVSVQKPNRVGEANYIVLKRVE